MMRKLSVFLSLMLFLICTASCAIGPTSAYVESSHTKLATGSNVSSKSKDAKIDVYNSEEDVNRKYQKVCNVEALAAIHPPSITFSSLVKWGLKPEARECGADAIIIQKRQQSDGRTIFAGVAIRYIDKGK